MLALSLIMGAGASDDLWICLIKSYFLPSSSFLTQFHSLPKQAWTPHRVRQRGKMEHQRYPGMCETECHQSDHVNVKSAGKKTLQCSFIWLWKIATLIIKLWHFLPKSRLWSWTCNLCCCCCKITYSISMKEMIRSLDLCVVWGVSSTLVELKCWCLAWPFLVWLR